MQHPNGQSKSSGLAVLCNLLQYDPHKAQKAIHQSQSRYRFSVWGRRAGKSTSARLECVRGLLALPDQFGPRYGMLTAPTYDHTMAIWEPTVDAIERHLKALKPRYHKSERYIELGLTGARLYRRSGDNPDSLRSKGFNFAVIDEAGSFTDEAYNALRPALSDRLGWLYAVGTPAGRNWFYTGFQRGLNAERDYFSLNAPSTVNPYFDPLEMEAARSDMPERQWRQEYLAEFIADVANVFSFESIKASTGGALEGPVSGAKYVAGADLAKYSDWTVIAVLRTDVMPWRVVAIDRFNRLPWDVQEKRLLELCSRYGISKGLVDKTGIGDAVVESLAKKNRKLEGFQFTGQSKEALVSGLAVALEQGKVQIPAACDVLIRELSSYEYQLKLNGHVAYSAPNGLHDDTVMALGLAVMAAGRPVSRIATFEGGL